jgi:hypothetical protein
MRNKQDASVGQHFQGYGIGLKNLWERDDSCPQALLQTGNRLPTIPAK